MNQKEKIALANKVLAYRKQYYAQNKEKIFAKAKEWRKKNPDKLKAYRENWILKKAKEIQDRNHED